MSEQFVLQRKMKNYDMWEDFQFSISLKEAKISYNAYKGLKTKYRVIKRVIIETEIPIN